MSRGTTVASGWALAGSAAFSRSLTFFSRSFSADSICLIVSGESLRFSSLYIFLRASPW